MLPAEKLPLYLGFVQAQGISAIPTFGDSDYSPAGTYASTHYIIWSRQGMWPLEQAVSEMNYAGGGGSMESVVAQVLGFYRAGELKMSWANYLASLTAPSSTPVPVVPVHPPVEV